MRRLLELLTLLSIVACHGDAGADRPPRPTADGQRDTLPTVTEGADRIGTPVDALWIEAWTGDPLALAGPGAARATLIRFWTDTCPFCAASLPALERLRLEYADEGLATLAVYHPKPPREVEPGAVLAAAAERGYHGPVALDPHWRALERMWLAGRERGATSASLLVDAEGVVRFVNPGPIFHPPGEEHGLEAYREQAESGWEDLVRAIRVLLAEG